MGDKGVNVLHGTPVIFNANVAYLPMGCCLFLGRLDDEEVPYTVSLDLSRRLASDNVNLYLVKVRQILPGVAQVSCQIAAAPLAVGHFEREHDASLLPWHPVVQS